MQNYREERPCGSCGEAVLWLKHERTGRPAPIEAKVSREGNILLDLDNGTYSIVPAAERAVHAGWLHLNHFATCPQAQTWAKVSKRP